MAFDAIRKAVTDRDAGALSRWVEYPINVRIGNAVVTIRDGSAFVEDYNEVFSDAMKAQRPLAEAQVDVREVKGKPGWYEAVAYLRPHFQLETLTTSMRLVAEVPKKK